MILIHMHYHNEDATCRCSNCEHECSFGRVGAISGFQERVSPGEICPAGECPRCGALMYLKTAQDSATND